MKYKTTRKAIVNGGGNICYCGYCDMWHLLRNHDAVAYTAGVYGWNFDVYKVYGLIICTGYRGMPGKRLEGVAEYEAKAKDIFENKHFRDDEKQKHIEALLIEFCVMNGGY